MLDARYRTTAKFGTFNLETSLPNVSAYCNITRKVVRDNKINVNDCNTSKYNCDIWMNYSSYIDNTMDQFGGPITGIPAVQYCRSITVPSVGTCSLPNINVLTRIGIERNYIDRLDPTVAQYPKKALGYRNSVSDFSFGVTYASGKAFM